MFKFTKEKLFLQKWDDKKEEWYWSEVNSFVPFLAEEMEISDDFTFRDLFCFLEKEKDNINLIFQSSLGHYDFNDFLKEQKLNLPNSDEDDEQLEYLELEWACELQNFKKYNDTPGNKDDIYLNLYPNFHGIGKDKKTNEIISYGIEASKLYTLNSCLIKIKKEFDIYDSRNQEEKSNLIPCSFYRNVTIFEFIHTILYEISFFGCPEQRDKEWKDIEKEGDELEKQIKNGTAKTFENMEDLIKDLNLDDEKDSDSNE